MRKNWAQRWKMVWGANVRESKANLISITGKKLLIFWTWICWKMLCMWILCWAHQLRCILTTPSLHSNRCTCLSWDLQKWVINIGQIQFFCHLILSRRKTVIMIRRTQQKSYQWEQQPIYVHASFWQSLAYLYKLKRDTSIWRVQLPLWPSDLVR